LQTFSELALLSPGLMSFKSTNLKDEECKLQVESSETQQKGQEERHVCESNKSIMVGYSADHLNDNSISTSQLSDLTT
jgi:hypothetical protein